MATQVPASVELALKQLLAGFKAVGLPELDPTKSSWVEIEKGVARLLGGPLDLKRPDHQAVVLGVAAALGVRLAQQDGAFWVHNRESPDGLVLGFPDALVMLSPFGAAMDALSRANLAQLQDVQKEIRAALGRARLSIAAGPQPKLAPEDYERLFDPGFVQFVLLDEQKLKEAWENPVSALTRNLRDALDRVTQVPPELKKQLDAQLLGAVASLDQSKSLISQLGVAGRMVELIAHLAATTEATPPAPEDFWAAVVLPLLFIGTPEKFPPFGHEEKEAVKQGVDPLFLYLDVVPYQMPAEEDGLLGAFGAEDVGLLHPDLRGLSPLRLLSLKLDRIGPALEKLNPAQSKEAFGRFCEYVKQQTGTQPPTGPSERVLGEALTLLGELKKIWDARAKGKTALRRITEAEAASDGALNAVRKALTGPRIILTP
ncbi:MAG: hypothetical protein IRZ16_02595 [Myxococcaceae bacterium]|nr:hypothetical protein [Myxococcaceae bacterium]